MRMGIQQQSQIAADAPLLAHREAEALCLGRLPQGASVARHPKKRDKKASLILSFSLTAGQPKPASFN